jgi:hypothetical protein
LTLEAFGLEEVVLRATGEQVTRMRAELRKSALIAGQADSEEGLERTQRAVEKLAAKMTRGYFESKRPRSTLHKAFKREVPAPVRKRGRLRGPLKLDEKLDIAQKVLVDFWKLEEVAKEYRVSANRVNQLIVKVRRNPKMLAEL